MSGELWQTPKTNWGIEAVPTTFFNRIEGNISVLHRGGGQAALQTAISANALVLPNETDDTFLVSGSTAVKWIDTTNRQPGNRITLIFLTGLNIPFDEASPPAGFASILSPFMIIVFPMYAVVDFVYSGTNWYAKLDAMFPL
jgi:hypothetical protein